MLNLYLTMKYENIIMDGDETAVRFSLVKPGKRQLVVLGVNPSRATDTKPDPTMTKVMGFAERNGFDGFVMLNLYPQRSTDLNGLHEMPDADLCRRNLQAIREAIAGMERPTVLVAFGNAIGKRAYLKTCLRDIVALLLPLHPQWKQIGQPTASGNPRHPSRAGYVELADFDMDAYLA